MAQARHKALLIGNARFERDPHNLPALKGPPEDLKLLEATFTDPVIGLHQAGDVRTLLDATRGEVSEAIDDFFNTAAPDDNLLFYYSGHGRQDANNSLFLCARDTRTDRLPSTGVGDFQINQMIATSHAARVVIILDCCHSGSFKGGEMSMVLAQASGRFLLTSCRDQQLASDAADAGGASAFTQHLVDALRLGEVDSNKDGYVTLSEVYHHILPKLKLATKQIPQLHLDKTVGDPPLVRTRPRTAPPMEVQRAATRPPSAARPILAVSDTKIELTGVRLGERLPPVVIDVFNEGDGELNWTVSTEDTWLEIETGKKSFKLKLNPTAPGPHRANVYVRDAGRGGSKRISVFADVLEPADKPELFVEQTTVDFGKLRVGDRAAPQVIRLVNRGRGELRVRAHATNLALRVTANDDVVNIEPDLAREVSLSGDVVIVSDGGRAVVKVTGAVEAGPVLVLKPGKTLDFGTIPANAGNWLRLTLENGGTGFLKWDFTTDGNFFTAAPDGPMALKATISQGTPPGSHLGTILIRSTGGEATVNVRAKIEEAEPPKLDSFVAANYAVNLSGWWQNPNGRLNVSGNGPVFQYADYNAFGMQVGSGTMTVNGPQIFVQGTAMFVPYTGQFFLNNPAMMSGTIACMGAQNPVVYTRC